MSPRTAVAPEPLKDRLIAAVLAIAATRGIDQATMREVAKEAGVSVGSVQYYCRTKDEMLLIACQHVVDRIMKRGQAVPRDGSVGSAIRAYAVEFLPLDDARAAEQRVYLAFAARASVTPALAQIQHTLTARLRSDCAAAFRLARERGEGHGEFDAEAAARATVAIIDGLVLHLLTDPAGMSAAEAVEVLDSHLSRYVDIGREATD
ncbi:TetR/AcrR family transcriptional regulator [Kribbella sp. NPDC051586]|uniref:TetR/AcrR family transcriptional regulator n=1 Tax=Kribbella sp. NPDC051586 TaxID=3364118 RepID=UPI003795C618